MDSGVRLQSVVVVEEEVLVVVRGEEVVPIIVVRTKILLLLQLTVHVRFFHLVCKEERFIKMLDRLHKTIDTYLHTHAHTLPIMILCMQD